MTSCFWRLLGSNCYTLCCDSLPVNNRIHASIHEAGRPHQKRCCLSPVHRLCRVSQHTRLKRLVVQLIRTLWDTAVENNLNLVRFFAFGVSPEYALQPSPGQYSEAIFRGLDYALEQLRTRGLKVCAAACIMLLHENTWCLFERCSPKVLIVSPRPHSPLRHIYDIDCSDMRIWIPHKV